MAKKKNSGGFAGFAPKAAPARKNPISRPAPRKQPIQTRRSSGGGGTSGFDALRQRYSGGGGGGGYSAPSGGGGYTASPATFSAPAPATAPAPPPPPALTWEDINSWDPNKKEDWVSGDATYTAQKSALQQELENLLAEIALQRTNYTTDYTNALSNLGWNDETDSWDPNNELGGYGQSYNNQQNDFANRGMLDSSAYARALENLTTSFNKQKGDLGQARSNFFNELDLNKTNAQKSNTQDLQRARADAIARRAAREGIV